MFDNIFHICSAHEIAVLVFGSSLRVDELELCHQGDSADSKLPQQAVGPGLRRWCPRESEIEDKAELVS